MAANGRGELLLLGTGTSVGVPAIGCACDICRSTDPKLQRTRASALVTSAAGRILIDTGPDLRHQFLRHGLTHADAVIYTHRHADHIFGLDDVRMFFKHLQSDSLPLFCEPDVAETLQRAFAYAFESNGRRTAGGPRVHLEPIARPTFRVLDQEIVPVPLIHGRFDCLGFRFGDLAYCTDVKEIPEESWPLLEGLETLILDAVRLEPHPTHLNLEEALSVIERLRPKRAYLTHISCRLDPEVAEKRLPSHVELAWDGLRIPF